MSNNYKVQKLENGLNLITVKADSVDTVNVIVYFPVGSRYESEKDNGISHFIEHMMFKGTEKRPNAYVLSTELDSMGAQFNAYTSKDMTAYYIKSSKDFIEKNISILGDMVCNSKFDIDEINKERGVIIQEMKKYEDLPEAYVEDIFEQLIFGEKDKLGQLIIGTEDNIKSFTRDQFINYKNTHYFGSNAFVCVVGNFDESNVLKLVEDNFKFEFDEIVVSDQLSVVSEEDGSNMIESLRAGNVKKILEQTEPKIKVLYKDIEQAHLKIGFPAFSYFDKESYSLSLFSAVFGECMSSRLFINIREKEGLCYNIYSSMDRYQDCGLFSISSGLDKDRVYEAISLIKKELLDVVNNGITEDEFIKAKSIIFGRMDVALEDTSNVAEYYGRQYLLQNRMITPDEKKGIINKVTLDEINDTIKKVINLNKLNLAIIGPYSDDAKFKELIKN